MATSIRSVLLMLAWVLLLSCTVKSKNVFLEDIPVGEYEDRLERLADDAVSEAIHELFQEKLKEQIHGPQTRLRKTYVKSTPKTKEFGRKSNMNLYAYRVLVERHKVSRKTALRLLSKRRPEYCSEENSKRVSCDPNFSYRTIDGTCNNLNSPYWGSSFIPFLRLLPSSYNDKYNEPRGGMESRLPNPRLISSTIHHDKILPDPMLTNMVGQFGQFVDHDLTLTPEEDNPLCCEQKELTDCWPINVQTDDSFYSSHKVRCLDFSRSTPYCFPSESGVREQLNVLTSFADLSNVYGSERERETHLRSYVGGELRTSKDNTLLLPLVQEVMDDLKVEDLKEIFKGDFIAGDDRVNEMPALAVLHTLFVREHNRIAKQIQKIQPSWDDETVFQKTRRIVIAEWQNILYDEYLPIILGSEALKQYDMELPSDLSAYTKYDPTVDASIFHSFATAAYRFGHTLINGMIEFYKDLEKIGFYRLRDNFFNSTPIYRDGGQGYNYILEGLTKQAAQTYDPFVTEDLGNFLLKDPKENFGSDLIARNLQRGRDHGIQTYNEYRKYCGFPSLPKSFDQEPPNFPTLFNGTWTQLSRLYKSPEDIDLFTGGLIELSVSDGLTGPTFNCLKSKQFYNIMFGDRFFFTHGNQAGSFSQPQLAHIRQRKFSDVICDNSQVKTITKDVFHRSSKINPTISCQERTPLVVPLLV